MLSRLISRWLYPEQSELFETPQRPKVGRTVQHSQEPGVYVVQKYISHGRMAKCLRIDVMPNTQHKFQTRCLERIKDIKDPVV